MARNYTQPEPVTVQSAIAEATAPAPDQEQPTRKSRKTYTEDEAQEFKKQKKTSGRKGVTGDRINLLFTPENYEYLKVMGRVTGIGATNFINTVLDQHRAANAELYEKARAFRESLENFQF